MIDNQIVYSLNLLVGVILAGVMSRHWRLEASGGSLRYWIVAAWTLTVADLLFIVRSAYPHTLTRLAPTLMVTVGQLALVYAAQHTMDRPVAKRAGAILLGVHTLFLLALVLLPELQAWRSVGNSIVWSGLAFWAARVLARPAGSHRSVMQLPALVLAMHGTLHLLRLALVSHFAAHPESVAAARIQLAGDLEVSLFMVALFVSVLVAFLDQRHRELQAAMADVRQLSSMLPLCAWCKNVRDDHGYWTRIEAYLANHQVNVTHGICEDCAAKHLG